MAYPENSSVHPPDSNQPAPKAPASPPPGTIGRSDLLDPQAPIPDIRARNWTALGLNLHPEVALVAGTAIVLMIGLTLGFPDRSAQAFDQIQDFITHYCGGFLIGAGNLYLVAVLYFAVGRYGHLRLGGTQARPEFSTFAWLAMLMSAGMGIGLMFWSVGEPLSHFAAPPLDLPRGATDSLPLAMGITFFHWGFHAWGIYALVALALGFATFNWGLPLTLRSGFYPLLKDKINQWPGHCIDILAVVATLFGLATSLGLGVEQIAAGVHGLWGAFPDTLSSQIILIAVITGVALVSLMGSLDEGVRRLSEWNLYLAAAFMAFIFLAGPSLQLLQQLLENLASYTTVLPTFSLWDRGQISEEWRSQWTLFYWGWWISWSPFVGMFIARVSRGRTVREFSLGVLLVPSLLSFLWLTVLGDTALDLTLADPALATLRGAGAEAMAGTGAVGETTAQVLQATPLGAALADNVANTLFVLVQQLSQELPGGLAVTRSVATIISGLGVLLVITFFVTSANSGALVVHYLTSGGKLHPPAQQKMIWAALEGVMAAVLLVGGGLQALQTASIATGLPFAGVLLLLCWSLKRGLAMEESKASQAIASDKI